MSEYDDVRQFERELERKDRVWDGIVRRVFSLFSDDGSRGEIERTEYGYADGGTIYPPRPFIRSAGMKNRQKWERMLDDNSEAFLNAESENAEREIADRMAEVVRGDVIRSAEEFGVRSEVAERIGDRVGDGISEIGVSVFS